DLLWMPSVETMYPYGAGQEVRIRVPGVTDVLEGAHRPGHFDGVATVVARLFNQVQPDVAAFGRKDYQRQAVIRYLVRDLAFPVELLAGETVREADGLAMSSRNQYLGEGERALAPRLPPVLTSMREAMRAGPAPADVDAPPRAAVGDLASPVELLAGEPVREAAGLAMSSRNQYLDEGERALAPRVHQGLKSRREAMRAGTAPADVEARARAALGEDGFDVDYAVVRRPDLTEVGATVGPGTYVALVAARLGRTRLIDNLEFELG